MSNVFHTTKLAGDRVLVQGTDANESTILDSTQFDELVARDSFKDAEASFNDAVQSFFAPIVEAAETAETLLTMARELADPAFSFELEPEVKGVEGKPAVRLHLDHDTVVLRMIASGDTSRLLWVNGQIEIVAIA